VAFISLIYINKEDVHESGINVIPVSSAVEGNIGNNLEIIIDKYPVFYLLNEEGYIDKIKITAKVQAINKYKPEENELLDISMHLKNKKGDDILFLSKSILKNVYSNKVRIALKQGSKREIQLPFYFEPKSDIKKVPENIEKFSINAVIDTIPIK